MKQRINKLIHYFTERPKTLFLIDSVGALLTLFFLFVMMWRFNQFIGMPKKVLIYLIIAGALCCVYSTTCFLFIKAGWAPFIKFIAMANLFYCVLTTVLLIKYNNILTIMGTIYFLIEMVIICALAYVELKVAMAQPMAE